MLAESLERLAARNIELLPLSGIETHFVFQRDGFVALVERTPEGFGQAGAPGLLTEQGFAALVWKSGRPFFTARGFEKAASAEEVTRLRAFARDLEESLS